MTLVRRLASLSLVLGFGHVVFGAIVRITGSGMGCGNHWPKCQGYWIPPFTRIDLVIEVSHRYFAATLTASIVALLVTTWMQRRQAGMAGRDGVLLPAALAAGLVVTAAIFGAITVWLELANKLVIVVHLSLAMSLLAVLVMAIVRSYEASAEEGPISAERGARSAEVSAASARAATIAAVLCFVTVVLGALTANIPGANVACAGFPLCEGGVLPSDPSQYLQFSHRIAAFALFFLVGWLGVVLAKRKEARLAAFARVALTVIFVQLIVAATMIQFHLPRLWRSLHEALGTLLWIVLFAFAYVANRRASQRITAPNESVVLGPAAEARA
jgi:heme A synthase